MIFAYLGFEQAIQFGGESRDPQRNIPFAVLGSMAIGAVVYILLEVAFLGALDPRAAAHGWANLSFTNKFGPFAALASLLGLGWLSVILYVDAFLSPAGTGLIYTGSSARVSYALGRNGYIPKRFGELDSRGVPWLSILFAFAVGMIVFLPFPGWQKLVAFITSASVIIYAAQCVSLAAMRRQMPDHRRSLRLPGASVMVAGGLRDLEPDRAVSRAGRPIGSCSRRCVSGWCCSRSRSSRGPGRIVFRSTGARPCGCGRG
ncbi:MAG: APC family permease [Solirubrobacteraceae bacterium]